jgi:hypothetical protein
MARPLHPRKDRIGEREISRICFQLVNENAGIETNPAVTPQE